MGSTGRGRLRPSLRFATLSNSNRNRPVLTSKSRTCKRKRFCDGRRGRTSDAMTFRIEHALVMDTDHLRGGGGYSVAAVSQGVREAERVFVAENFGISDFLHDPKNQRVYYSIF